MQRPILIYLIAPAALLVSLIAQPACAQQEPMPGRVDPFKAAFAQQFNAYKTAVQEFEALRTEFQTAAGARRDEINAQLGNYYTTLKQRVKAMVDAAIASYTQAPNTDDQVTDMLLSVAEHDVRGVGQNSQGGDNYERALQIVSTLVDGGLAEEHKQLPIYGIVAAFATSKLDQAERMAQVAEQVGAFQKSPPDKDTVAVEVFTTALRYAQMIPAERKIVDAERLVRDAEAAADDLPRVKMTTSKGDVVIELFENEAPQAVGNFISLVKQGYYDGLYFHRVLPRFMAQGGCPDGEGTGGPGYNIRCECYAENARKHFRGTLSMAHAGRDTGGSQFFLTFVPTRHLDGRHTVFGQVIEGLEVLAELQRINPGERGVTRDQIVRAEVLRDRGHAYAFEKLPARR